MKKIRISKKGFYGNGIYIGRGSSYGNPYLTKKSKFPGKIYSVEESLKLYENDLLSGLIDISPLVNHVKEWDIITLDCFCINANIKKDYDFSNPKCHGEIIAKHIFKHLGLL